MVAGLSLDTVKGNRCTFQLHTGKFLRTQKRGGWKSLVHSSAQPRGGGAGQSPQPAGRIPTAEVSGHFAHRWG